MESEDTFNKCLSMRMIQQAVHITVKTESKKYLGAVRKEINEYMNKNLINNFS